MQMPDKRQIKYTRSDGLEKTAEIVHVDFPVEDLEQEDLEVLDNLSQAADNVTPIFAAQQDSRTKQILRSLLDLEKRVDPEKRQSLDDFITLYEMKNGPVDRQGLGIRFPDIYDPDLLLEFPELYNGRFNFSAGRNLYPFDITKEEFEKLENKNTVNSFVRRRQDGTLQVHINEKLFAREIEPIIKHLEKARAASKNERLNDYIDAKIVELKNGSEQNRSISDHTWLKNTGNLDFVISTGSEIYIDQFQGRRGAASGAVYVTDRSYLETAQNLIRLLPKWEAEAPWKRKKQLNSSNMPRIKFVNVFNGSADYHHFPGVLLAESLPNDEDFKRHYGSANIMFVNIEKAKGTRSVKLVADEFFLDDIESYLPLMADVNIKTHGSHELGHALGNSIIKEPRIHFGEEYNMMEEHRAETFSLWALPRLEREGMMNYEHVIAGYYSMLVSMISSLQQKPIDHNGARNMMFHYFLKKGAIIESEIDGKTKYGLNIKKLPYAVEEMLTELGIIKGEGDKEYLARFKSEYLIDDKRKSFEARLSHMPLGTGLVFPYLEKDLEGYTGKLIYPVSFRDQRSSLEHFV